MKRMGVYDQIKAAIQDRVAPAFHEIRGEIQAIRAELNRIDHNIDSVDARIDGVDRELRTAIDIRERLAALEARRA